MTMTEWADSYQESSDLCRRRAEELEKQVLDPALGEMQRMDLRRRIGILYGMARETRATAQYLRTYRREEKSV